MEKMFKCGWKYQPQRTTLDFLVICGTISSMAYYNSLQDTVPMTLDEARALWAAHGRFEWVRSAGKRYLQLRVNTKRVKRLERFREAIGNLGLIYTSKVYDRSVWRCTRRDQQVLVAERLGFALPERPQDPIVVQKVPENSA